MIRNILWDFDGTLFDTYPAFAAAFRQALLALHKDAPLDWLQQLCQRSMGHCVTTLAEQFALDPQAIIDQFTLAYAATTPEDQPPFPAAIDVCREIAARGGLNVIVTHRSVQGMLALLDANGMRPLFAGWISAEDNFPDKPDPASFLAIMERHALDPAETLGVGDRCIDVLAGQTAGITTCLFGPPSPDCTADRVISDLADLLE